MKALVLERGEVKLKNIARPLPAENEALVKVLKAGICSLDLEIAAKRAGELVSSNTTD